MKMVTGDALVVKKGDKLFTLSALVGKSEDTVRVTSVDKYGFIHVQRWLKVRGVWTKKTWRLERKQLYRWE